MAGISSQPYGPRISDRAVGRSLGGVSSQPPGRRIFFQLGDDIAVPIVEDPATKAMAVITARTETILKLQKEEIERRRIAMIVTAAGAVFAFARLGIIAFPHLKKRIRPDED